MKKKIKVFFDGKVFSLEEPVELRPNTHYTAILEPEEEKTSQETLKKILKHATDLEIKDLAKQHDHYLYGTEKR